MFNSGALRIPRADTQSPFRVRDYLEPLTRHDGQRTVMCGRVGSYPWWLPIMKIIGARKSRYSHCAFFILLSTGVHLEPHVHEGRALPGRGTPPGLALRSRRALA